LKPSILMMGLNHTTAPVHVREGISCTRAELATTLPALASQDADSPLSEVFILSTCNRTEVYVVTQDAPRAMQCMRDFFSARTEFPPSALDDFLYTFADRDAVVHLLSVACGLDSMILGEFEIQGQVRAAYEIAARQKTIGAVLTTLCHTALHTGKRARAETTIGAGAASVAYAAVALARQQLGDLTGRSALILGAGEMAQRAAKNLAADGACTVIVANRTYAHALDLASEINARAIGFDQLSDALAQADIVLSATAAPHIVLTAQIVHAAMAMRAERPMCLIDIAVPRNIDPRVADIPNVRLFNIDALQNLVDANRALREQAVDQVRAIIAEQADEFWHWYLSRRAVPVIAKLRERAENIRTAELDKALRRLGHLNLNERDRNVIAALSAGIVSKLLAAPTVHLKECVLNGDSQIYLDTLRELFELE
jgi:glutamyl-tRNA reductase